MIWEKKCASVVMIPKNEEAKNQLTAQYWPENFNAPVTFGKFEISLKKIIRSSDSIHRRLTLRYTIWFLSAFLCTCVHVACVYGVMKGGQGQGGASQFQAESGDLPRCQYRSLPVALFNPVAVQ